jgi:uncharacterized protein with WD repeat
MSCGQSKLISEFDRAWEFEGRTYGYCLRCNGKAFTEEEKADRRIAQRDAQRERRSREKKRREALSDEELQRENAERKSKRRAKELDKKAREQRKLEILEEINKDRAAEGLDPYTEDDISY